MEDASNKHPRQTAGFISLLTFSWLSNILKQGSKNPLEEKHLFPLERSFHAKDLVDFLEREWLAEVRWSQQTRTKPRLWRAMLRIIRYREYIILALLRIFYSLSMNLLPLMVWLFLKSISSGSSEISYASSLPFVVCISVTSVARNIFVTHGLFKGEMCQLDSKWLLLDWFTKRYLYLLNMTKKITGVSLKSSKEILVEFFATFWKIKGT